MSTQKHLTTNEFKGLFTPDSIRFYPKRELIYAEEFGLEEDLSNYLGTATETVIRLLSEYKIKGLIESRERKIILLNIEKIKTIAGM